MDQIGRECRAPTSADCAATPGARSGPVHEQRSPVLPPIVSMVSIDRGGDDDHPTRGAGAMASRGLSPLLPLEISKPGRPATNRCGSAGIYPADCHVKCTLGSA